MDITTIPTSELISDLADSLNDIYVCKTALALNVTSYGADGDSVQHRLDANKYFVKVITAELEKRTS